MMLTKKHERSGSPTKSVGFSPINNFKNDLKVHDVDDENDVRKSIIKA